MCICDNSLGIFHFKVRRISGEHNRLKESINKLWMDRTLSDEATEVLKKYIDDSVLQNELSYGGEKGLAEALKDSGSRDAVYSPQIRAFAMTLSFYSRRGYEYVREQFGNNLPSLRTIRRWHQSVNGMPGLTESVIPILKKKIAAAKEKNKELLFSLQFDEMSIKHKIEFDKNSDRMFGFEDLGQKDLVNQESEVDRPAREALVFLISAINDRFKAPVAYYIIHGKLRFIIQGTLFSKIAQYDFQVSVLPKKQTL